MPRTAWTLVVPSALNRKDRRSETQTSRITITPTSTASHEARRSARRTAPTRHRGEDPAVPAGRSAGRPCSPAGTEMVAQLTRSLSRDWPVWITGDLWPSTSPAVTTAITPEPWKSPSPSSRRARTRRTAPCSEIAVSNTGCGDPPPDRRDHGGHQTVRPAPRRRAAIRKPPVTSATETAPPMATMATRRQVMAVASLTRDSPSRMVTSRRGRPDPAARSTSPRPHPAAPPRRRARTRPRRPPAGSTR